MDEAIILLYFRYTYELTATATVLYSHACILVNADLQLLQIIICAELVWENNDDVLFWYFGVIWIWGPCFAVGNCPLGCYGWWSLNSRTFLLNWCRRSRGGPFLGRRKWCKWPTGHPKSIIHRTIDWPMWGSCVAAFLGPMTYKDLLVKCGPRFFSISVINKMCFILNHISIPIPCS